MVNCDSPTSVYNSGYAKSVNQDSLNCAYHLGVFRALRALPMNTYTKQHRLLSLKALVFTAVIISHCSYAVPIAVPETLIEKVQMQYGLTAERNWRPPDDRADALRSLENHTGDGQGFTMTKFFTPDKMGMPLSIPLSIPIAKPKVGYVTVTVQVAGFNQSTARRHTVLTYFSTVDAETFILDSIDKRIRRASLRTDLEPVYLFEAGEMLFPDRIPTILPIEKTGHDVQWQNLLPNLKAVHY